ncbi:MAG TPA: hypothetical protein VK814_07925 [Acidobacteriaceae bacterium]|jgi:hypothetical protein|nr:hypothetical protein [Acidobacteriaceae bacterium]
MDVHLPHHPVRRWSDFWVHLGTITAGLLIALGLEHAVGVLHRLHQRHDLQHDLHAEAERNEQILAHDIDVLQHENNYFVALRSNVDALRRGTDAASLPQLPERSGEDPFLPSAGAWTSARDSSQLSLLPREQASIYEELYAQRDFLQQAVFDWFHSSDELETFLSNTQAADATSHLDPAQLTPAQQDQYSELLSQQITRIGSILGDLRFYESENSGVLHGVSDIDELHQQVLSRTIATSPSTIKSDDSSRKNP